MRAHLPILSASLILAFAYACSSSGADANPTSPTADAAGGGDSTQLPPGTCGDGIVLVAPTGDDAAPGCGGRPKKTIQAALASAKATPGTKEIQVCAGTYKEARIVLDFAVGLSGGYSCADFKRADGNETVLTSDDPETLVIANAAVDSKVRIDGLTVRGSASGTTAVLVREGAKPVLSNLQVFGGDTATAAATTTSTGIRITSGAAPEIEKTKIDGGNGTSTAAGTPGSIGLAVETSAGEVRLRESTVNGGRGSALIYASLAVQHQPGAPKLTIEKSTLDGGGGTGKGNTDPVELVSAGLVAGGTIELFDSSVSGGKGTCTSAAAACRSAAVLVVTTAAGSRFERNRIYGGDAVSTAAQRSSPLALSVDGPGTIVNNLVHLGGANPRRTIVTEDHGISLRRGDKRLVAHNTIVAAPNPNAAPSNPPPTNVQDHFLIEVADGETKARVINNVLLGTETLQDHGVFVNACTKGSLGELRANVFIGFPNQAFDFRFQIGGVGACDQAASYAGMKALEDAQNYQLAGSASANFRVDVSCGFDTAERCLAEPSCFSPHPGCIPKAVAFDAASFGLKDLEAGGWKPNAGGVICTASARSIDLTADVPNDFANAPRSKGVTIGAHELAGCP